MKPWTRKTPQEAQVEGAPARDAADAAAEAKPLPDLAYHLYFGQFQQLSWLAMAAAGGALLMYQAGVFRIRPWSGIVAALLFAFAALVAVLGPMELVRGVTEGKDIRRTVRRYLVVSLFLLGTGTGAIAMALIRNALAG